MRPEAAPQAQPDAASAPDPLAYEGSDLETLLVLRRYRQWILDELQPHVGGRAVEIGAGIGTYSPDLLQRALSLDLVEPSSSQHQRLLERFAGDVRAHVIQCSAEQWAASAEPGSYDSVVMINVLEHIEDDRAVLKGIHRALKPKGRLLIFVPALMVLYSKLDRLFGHYRRYHRAELLDKTKAAGFEMQRCRYFDLLGTVPWFLVNRLAGATRFSAGAARLYDAIGVPVTRALERVITPPFGKNLVLVATKP